MPQETVMSENTAIYRLESGHYENVVYEKQKILKALSTVNLIPVVDADQILTEFPVKKFSENEMFLYFLFQFMKV